MANDPKNFGVNVRSFRKLRKFSQKKLASMIRVEQSILCKIEKGRYNTSLSLYNKICKALTLWNAPLL